VTLGIVSAVDRTIGTEGAYLNGLIQTDAAISSGNSGGPLVNARGEVVGINTAVARGTATSAASNVGFAISAKEALPVIDALRAQAGGEPRAEGYLGVELDDRRDGGQGVVIRSVQDDTPASDAGVEEGDLVVAVDGAATDGAVGLIAAIRDLQPGDSTTITVVRDGERIDLDVTLTDRPED
jgi:S1-C subfamily serine protease